MLTAFARRERRPDRRSGVGGALAWLAGTMSALGAAAGTAAPACAPMPPPPSPLGLSCLTCHAGPARSGEGAGPLSSLAPSTLAQALRAFRDGQRTGTVMPRLARPLSDEDIAQLARELGAGP